MNAMDEIPDHAIQSPFGRSTLGRTKQTERFNRYREHIVKVYREIYNTHLLSSRGFTCPICDSYIGCSKSGKILAHLASLKHLRVALGDELQECDKCDGRRVGRKHTIYSTATPIHPVVADISGCLCE